MSWPSMSRDGNMMSLYDIDSAGLQPAKSTSRSNTIMSSGVMSNSVGKGVDSSVLLVFKSESFTISNLNGCKIWTLLTVLITGPLGVLIVFSTVDSDTTNDSPFMLSKELES